MLPRRTDLTLPFRLTAVLLPTVAATAILGLIYGDGGLYDRYPAALAGLVGQDMVTLAVGVPLLVGGAWLARRGSIRGLLVWCGSLFYLAYTYFFLVVGAFNELFLGYVAVVALSLYALLAILFRLDPGAVRARFTHPPSRWIAAYFGVIVALFVVMWGGASVGAAVAGEELEPVMHQVIAIDGAVLLPLLAYGAVLVWRRAPWGHVLAGLLLVKATLSGVGLAFVQGLGMAWAGELDPFQTFLGGIFGLMALGGVALLVPYLRLARAGQHSSVPELPAEVRVGPPDAVAAYRGR